MKRKHLVALAMGGALMAFLAGVLWRRPGREGTRSDTIVGTSGTGEAGIGGSSPVSSPGSSAPDTGPPRSPLGAAAFYAQRLKACEPPPKPLGPNPPVTSFGRGEPGWGVTFRLTAGGDLLAAELWGQTGKMKPCLTSTVGSWPRAATGRPTMTVQFPMEDIVYGRRPGGEVQLLASTIYDEKAISPAVVKGDWLAICPRPGGSELLPAAPIAARAETEDGMVWEVKSSACPGDDVVMIKGAEVGRWAPALASPDGGAADAASSPSTDASADRRGLPTVTVDQAKLIDAEGTTLTLGDRSVRVFTQNVVGREETGEQILFAASGAVVQVLADNGSEFRITWAGDLDGDGGIDFVTCNSSDAPTYDLFLSSRAGGRLVRHAARVVGTDAD